ncbi:N-acetylmuramoyl-L-alanine amidase [Ruegeria sp. SCPT10]|uniref:N-acetylmuramoyl-L-alanine amidase n=1 Tax=Ruegeria sp. SCP10 TaxID=3141377 RepID=UPI00333C59FC
MPVVQEIIAKEENEISFLRSRGEIEDATYKGLDVLYFKPSSRDGYFYKSIVPKEKIALHYTAGYLGGDLGNLTRDNYHVSVPFVIAASGKIVQLFDPSYWSYHLTPGAVGGNERNSSRSVAIEMSNLGPLERSGSWMWNYVGSKYCRASETDFFVDLNESYRGYRYYAYFTDEQYQSLNRLLDVLCAEFGIPRTFLPEANRYDLFPTASAARNYRGICSHVNFQPPSVKQDIGPAFRWDIIGAL